MRSCDSFLDGVQFFRVDQLGHARSRPYTCTFLDLDSLFSDARNNLLVFLNDGCWDHVGLGWRSNYLCMLKRNRLRLVWIRYLVTFEVRFQFLGSLPLLSVEQLLQQVGRLKVKSDEVCHVQFIVDFLKSSFFCSFLLCLIAGRCVSQAGLECRFVDLANQIACESIRWNEPAYVKAKSPNNALKATNVTEKVQNTVDCSFGLATVKIRCVFKHKHIWLRILVIERLGSCGNGRVIIKRLTLAQI